MLEILKEFRSTRIDHWRQILLFPAPEYRCQCFSDGAPVSLSLRALPPMITSPAWSFRQSPSAPLERLSEAQIDHFSSVDDDFDRIDALPAEIHTELLRLGRIEDPFLRDNELSCQWVAEKSWLLRGTLAGRLKECERAELVLDRVDTFAYVWLDGILVHENDNGLHCDQRVDVSHLMQESDSHILLVQFLSPVLQSRKLMRESTFKATCWNGEPSRCYARKLQYHYGWDWGPTLLSIGVQGDVRIELFEARILDLYPRLRLDDDLRRADLIATGLVQGRCRHAFLRLTDPSGTVVDHDIHFSKDGHFEASVEVKNPLLWWPNGLGQQPLYNIEAYLCGEEGRVLYHRLHRIGARKFQVVRKPLEETAGETFLFEINNQPMFAAGSNWIPPDSFLSRVTKDRLRRWLELARGSHQNTLRVWGGGTYETDDFYDLCDELGLLVWQDCPFACGLYPADETFCRNVRAEIEANVKRIRHHASLAVLAGNNEDYQVAEAMGFYRSTSDFDPIKFPAKKIYEEVLPNIIETLIERPTFFPGCPWNGGNTRDPTRGDIHQWNVWHGPMEPYQNWSRLSGRFVSEWGMQAYPDRKTVNHWLDGAKGQNEPKSKLVQYHQKATDGTRRLNKYIDENFRRPYDLDNYIYISQLMQADCVREAVQTWRRGFKGPERYQCAGSLVWQLQDTWPAISWSLVDYFERPKLAYYSMKHALNDLAIGSNRYSNNTTVEIWVSNVSRKSFDSLRAIIKVFDINSGTLVNERQQRLPASPMTCLELSSLCCLPTNVVSIQLIDDAQKTMVAQHTNWPEPIKAIRWSPSDEVNFKVRLDVLSHQIFIAALRPVKGCSFNVSSDDVKLSDNGVDIMPDDERNISYAGELQLSQLSWSYLGMGL